MKRALLALMVVLAATLAIASVAMAGSDKLSGPNGEHKVVVCKYVGTPGVDERLQTGQNPIVVDYHALLGAGFTGTFPFAFSDAQGKSVAVQWTFDEQFSDLSVCPAPVGPPPCTEDCGPPPCTTDCGPPPCVTDCGPPVCTQDCEPTPPPVTPPHHKHKTHVPKSPGIKQYIQDVTHGADTGGG